VNADDAAVADEVVREDELPANHASAEAVPTKRRIAANEASNKLKALPNNLARRAPIVYSYTFRHHENAFLHLYSSNRCL
jgi:hypothetical protein